VSDPAAAVEQEAPRKPRQWSQARRDADAKRRAGGRLKGDADLVAEDVVGEAVDHLITVAGIFIVPVAPHVGLTIAGVPHPDAPAKLNALESTPQDWLVQCRAAMAGRALLEHARRNTRVLALVGRFNALFRNVELLEVAGALAASVAVDAHLAPADAVAVLPGGARYPIFQPVIGDVIDFIASQRPPEPLAPERVDKRARNSHAAGAWSGDGAAATEEPTLRREGQAVIEGGVQDT
jgi:hypothetical protein